MNDKPRLIDADVLCNKLNNETMLETYNDFKQVNETIMNAPTIDAVPVVRCGKCINYSHGDCICSLKDGSWGENDFCSDGTMHY